MIRAFCGMVVGLSPIFIAISRVLLGHPSNSPRLPCNTLHSTSLDRPLRHRTTAALVGDSTNSRFESVTAFPEEHDITGPVYRKHSTDDAPRTLKELERHAAHHPRCSLPITDDGSPRSIAGTHDHCGPSVGFGHPQHPLRRALLSLDRPAGPLDRDIANVLQDLSQRQGLREYVHFTRKDLPRRSRLRVRWMNTRIDARPSAHLNADQIRIFAAAQPLDLRRQAPVAAFFPEDPRPRPTRPVPWPSARATRSRQWPVRDLNVRFPNQED